MNHEHDADTPAEPDRSVEADHSDADAIPVPKQTPFFRALNRLATTARTSSTRSSSTQVER